MLSTHFTFTSQVWVYPGPAVWYFVTLPKTQSQGIKRLYHGLTGGFGSLPVRVTIGAITWTTSIFPDMKVGAYMLPLKKKVRQQAGIGEGDRITYTIEVMV